MNVTPAKSLRNFRFCTLAGVTDVRQVGNEVHGRWQEALHEYYGPPSGRLIEEFLNWPDDLQAIVRFTRKYGPLYETPVSGATFGVNTHAWIGAQAHMRNLWQQLSRFPDWQPQGGCLAYRNGFLTYTAANLYMFLYMDLVTCMANRARTCKRQDCPHRYFIAGNLKQTFCSEVCAQWGQRQWKKEWWTEHGKSWRAKRRRQKQNGGKNGTRKAR